MSFLFIKISNCSINEQVLIFSPCIHTVIARKKTASGLTADMKKVVLRGATGRDFNLAVILREIVGKSSELAYNVVFCRVVTVRNGDDCGLVRVHLDIFSRNRDVYTFPWNNEEICV